MGELLQVALSGPLEEHAEGFAGELARQGYAPSVVVIHVRKVLGGLIHEYEQAA